jgi:hypothetical protein
LDRKSNKQCTKALATTSGRRVAANDKLLLLGQFDFNPGAAAPAGLVVRIRLFGDQAFEVKLLCYLKKFFSDATERRPFRKLAKTVRQHWDGILAYFDTRLTSAAIEAINGIVQLAKRMAWGFKNFVYFRTVAYHRAGKLNLAVPNIS